MLQRSRAVRALTLALLAASWLSASPALGAVFDVDSILDSSDLAPGDGVCDASVGLGTCTLRAAIEEANALPNVASVPDRIEFSIGAGPVTLTPSLAGFQITEAVVIDGTTQPGSAVNTSQNAFNAVIGVILDGSSLGGNSIGLLVMADEVTIRGLEVRSFGEGVVFQSGELGRVDGCRIEANSVYGVRVSSSRNVIGGGVPSAANLVSGNSMALAGILIDSGVVANIVNGNLVGTNDGGFAADPNLVGIEDRGTSTTIVRNLVSGNAFEGMLLSGAGGTVQGNYVGTTASKTSVLGNFTGIVVQGANYQIGGTVDSHANVVAGSSSSGIELQNAHGTRLEGNAIGANRGGIGDLGNSGAGIFVSASFNTIGGSTPYQGNWILNNDFGAIQVVAGDRNRIASNLMSRNGGMLFPGIDLWPLNLVNPNDPGDADAGANGLQNHPVLDAATRSPSLTHIEGSLDSAPGDYTLDFYANEICHASGHGEGEQLLGTRTITLPGESSFAFDLPVGAIGPVFTATATDVDGNSSEWSPCLAIGGSATADLGVTKQVVGGALADPSDLVEFQIRVSNPGPLPAINTVVQDTLAPGLIFVSADPPESDFDGVDTLTWDLGTVPVNSSATLMVTAAIDGAWIVPDGICAGYANVLQNDVSVANDQLDLNAVNDQASATVPVRTGNDLGISLSPSTQGVEPGDTAPLTVMVRNDGPEDATGVMASGMDPNVDCASAPFTSCDGAGNWTWFVGDLADGTALSLDFEVDIDVAAVPGPTPLVSIASVAPIGDPICDDVLAEALIGVGGSADLEIVSVLVVQDDDGSGSATAYLRNNGPTPIDRISYSASAQNGFEAGCGDPPSGELDLPLGSPALSFCLVGGNDVVHLSVTPLRLLGGGSGGSYAVFDPLPGNNSVDVKRSAPTSPPGSDLPLLFACGLGAELVLVLPVLAWLRLRRRSRR